MKLTEMIELANNGIKAKDVLTLHKQGFTKDIILELSEEPAKEVTEPETESEPENPTPADHNEPEPEPEDNSQANPAILEIEKLKKELQEQKDKVSELQKQNRKRNIDNLEGEDPLKNISDYISSMM